MADRPLTLPGSIPGLLRRGSPVVVVGLDDETTDREGQRLSLGESAVVTDPPWGADGWCIAAGTTTSGEGPAWSELPARALSLDLTDATGRAHAARWLAEHGGPGLPVGLARRLPVGLAPRLLECLADLDPADPRALPDGSRWVDAEALRRVVLHVAGLW